MNPGALNADVYGYKSSFLRQSPLFKIHCRIRAEHLRHHLSIASKPLHSLAHHSLVNSLTAFVADSWAYKHCQGLCIYVKRRMYTRPLAMRSNLECGQVPFDMKTSLFAGTRHSALGTCMYTCVCVYFYNLIHIHLFLKCMCDATNCICAHAVIQLSGKICLVFESETALSRQQVPCS